MTQDVARHVEIGRFAFSMGDSKTARKLSLKMKQSLREFILQVSRNSVVAAKAIIAEIWMPCLRKDRNNR